MTTQIEKQEMPAGTDSVDQSELIRRYGTTPSPGSDAAVAMGCTCPRMDNGYGKLGDDIGMYWITDNCPLHDVP